MRLTNVLEFTNERVSNDLDSVVDVGTGPDNWLYYLGTKHTVQTRISRRHESKITLEKEMKESKGIKLFLDTEFNGFGGKLMSMALVPEDNSRREFYKELEMNDQLDPWVKENVVPHLVLLPCSHHKFQQDLAQYLLDVGDCTIVADWPDDIRYFCESLITGPGQMISYMHNLMFELDLSIEYESKVPHNALHDARAIKEAYMKRL